MFIEVGVNTRGHEIGCELVSKSPIGYTEVMLICMALLLNFIGCMALYSAAGCSGEGKDIWALKHALMGLSFAFIAIVIATVHISVLYRYGYIFYFTILLFLIFGEIVGHTAMGAQRWLKIGIVSFQPSEVMKLALIVALAKYFSSKRMLSGVFIEHTIMLSSLLLLPVLLVLKQPNLGNAMILVIIASVIIFCAGIKMRYFALVLCLFAAAVPIVWQHMHLYQKQRVLTFLNPEKDPLGAGYNIMQSKIAIGAGGFSGRGFMQGSQSQLNFLPEKHTDFIFTLIAEEFGFLGVICVLFLYLSFISLSCVIALSSNNHLGALLAIGIASMFFIHFFINVAMISGVLPVVGTPLPFISYGGSNLATCWFSVGVLMLVSRNKFAAHCE